MLKKDDPCCAPLVYTVCSYHSLRDSLTLVANVVPCPCYIPNFIMQWHTQREQYTVLVSRNSGSCVIAEGQQLQEIRMPFPLPVCMSFWEGVGWNLSAVLLAFTLFRFFLFWGRLWGQVLLFEPAHLTLRLRNSLSIPQPLLLRGVVPGECDLSNHVPCAQWHFIFCIFIFKGLQREGTFVERKTLFFILDLKAHCVISVANIMLMAHNGSSIFHYYSSFLIVEMLESLLSWSPSKQTHNSLFRQDIVGLYRVLASCDCWFTMHHAFVYQGLHALVCKFLWTRQINIVPTYSLLAKVLDFDVEGCSFNTAPALSNQLCVALNNKHQLNNCNVLQDN